MLSRQEITDMAQWNAAYERLIRAYIPREEIPVLLREMGMEHIRRINLIAREQRECPNCPNEFHPSVLDDALMDGNKTITCQGCRSKLWLAVDEEHYGTIIMIHKPTGQS